MGRPLLQPLFAPLDPFAQSVLDSLPEVLDELMPLSRAHRADLPDAVRELSAMLTAEREEISRSYWSAPRFVSAYLRYFLPWNLVRLTRLLPSLDLPSPVPASAGPEPAAVATSTAALTVADLGSGPLTLPLALWMSRPEWRNTPLTLICADTAPRPMELGRKLLELVAARTGTPLVWRVRLLRAPLQRALREMPPPRLIMAGNVLNELRDKGGEILSERMGELAGILARKLDYSPESGALFVEPGTRLGGTLTASLREAALEEELTPLAPCAHNEECPLLGRRNRGWCHATQDAGGPAWLAALSKAAGLPKDSLSLSFLLLRPQRPHPVFFPAVTRQSGQSGQTGQSGANNIIAGRVLSDAFPVPGLGYARYACTSEGLAILPDAGGIPSGALVACRHPEVPRRDAKSGAIVLRWEAVPTEKPGTTGKAGASPSKAVTRKVTSNRSGDVHD